ncbi:hypothetical protein BRD18_07245 [Halobacteriales archaeon SW_7_71_33]|nr:MAG: hypothetical protein BRD18_07245 [Halobacteriales archaeon SW_7_71_33]
MVDSPADAYADADDPGAFFDLLAAVAVARREAADAPWTGDVEFYRELAREHEPALEVGVGTGRVYLDLLAAGLDVDGGDRSADGLVYAPARTINHLPTLSTLRGAFAAARECLRPGGRFAFNTFVPGFEVVAEQYGEERVREFSVDGVPHREVSVTRLTDELEQVAHIRRTLYRDGERVATRETPLALYPKRVLELALEAAGFSEWTLYGGFDREPPTADRETVWVAEP